MCPRGELLSTRPGFSRKDLRVRGAVRGRVDDWRPWANWPGKHRLGINCPEAAVFWRRDAGRCPSGLGSPGVGSVGVERVETNQAWNNLASLEGLAAQAFPQS